MIGGDQPRTQYTCAARVSRARRPSPPARRAVAPHRAATEEKTRDDRRRPATRKRRRGPPWRAMSRLSCGGDRPHTQFTRAARVARASPVAPRAPRPRSARGGDCSEDARRPATTGDERRRGPPRRAMSRLSCGGLVARGFIMIQISSHDCRRFVRRAARKCIFHNEGVLARGRRADKPPLACANTP